MTWTEWLPAVTGVVYVAAALGYWWKGQSGLALTYLAYAVANVGLIMAAVQGRGT